MVLAKQAEGECGLLKQNSSSEQSKSQQKFLKGIRKNVYWFGSPVKLSDTCLDFSCSEEGEQSLLDLFLLSQWEDHAWNGKLSYDITTCEIKIISGRKKFIAQLNEKWSSSSPTGFERRMLPMNTTGSCLMKIHKEDILLCVSRGEKEASELVPSTVLPKNGILIVSNATPVEYCHVILVPYDVHQMPQLLDKNFFGLITQIAVDVQSSSFRIFLDYDASTNSDENYFQACHFADRLPVELVSTIPVYGDLSSGIQISELANYPLKALVFTSKSWKTLVAVVGELCFTLHDNNTTFSLLICDRGNKMIIFPQVNGLPKGYHLSTWECAGYFVYNSSFDFEHVSETAISKLMETVALDDDSFQALKQLSCSIALKTI